MMENQKIINVLDNTPNQPYKFRTENYVEKRMNCVEHTTPIASLSLKICC